MVQFHGSPIELLRLIVVAVEALLDQCPIQQRLRTQRLRNDGPVEERLLARLELVAVGVALPRGREHGERVREGRGARRLTRSEDEQRMRTHDERVVRRHVVRALVQLLGAVHVVLLRVLHEWEGTSEALADGCVCVCV